MPKSVLRAVLGRMQFTLHATCGTPHEASRLVQATSAWLVKTRRAPSRHCRGAKVNGHATTVMHKLSTRPLPSRTIFQAGFVDNEETAQRRTMRLRTDIGGIIHTPPLSSCTSPPDTVGVPNEAVSLYKAVSRYKAVRNAWREWGNALITRNE